MKLKKKQTGEIKQLPKARAKKKKQGRWKNIKTNELQHKNNVHEEDDKPLRKKLYYL